MKGIKYSHMSYKDLKNIIDFTLQKWDIDQAKIVFEHIVLEIYGWFLKTNRALEVNL